MNNELILLMKKHTDTLIEPTKARPQETLEIEMKKQSQTFLFNPPLNLVEEGKWLLGLTSLECTNSAFNITNENKSLSITIPGHWRTESGEKTIDELNNLLELRSLQLHVKEVRKRRNQMKMRDNEYKLSDFDTEKNQILENFKFVKYNVLEDLDYRFQITYDEIIDILDLKFIPKKRIGYSLNLGICEVVDLSNTLRYILPIM